MTIFEAERVPEYLMALKSPHPEYGMSWSLGKTFARCCGAENDAAVVQYGVEVCGSSVRIADELRGLKIYV